MQVEMERVREVLIVRVKGELDLAVADELRSTIDENLKSHETRILIMDLEGVSFIDSSGLGVILGRYKKVSGQGGKMYIVRVRPPIDRILEISGVTRLIPIYASEKEILNNE